MSCSSKPSRMYSHTIPANLIFWAMVPVSGRLPTPKPEIKLEQWSLSRIGISEELGNIHEGGKGVAIGLVDAPVDITHPTFSRKGGHAISEELAVSTDPAAWRDSEAVINVDYPISRDARMAFNSKGGGHGTAMGGLIVGTKSDLCPLWGLLLNRV